MIEGGFILIVIGFFIVAMLGAEGRGRYNYADIAGTLVLWVGVAFLGVGALAAAFREIV